MSVNQLSREAKPYFPGFLSSWSSTNRLDVQYQCKKKSDPPIDCGPKGKNLMNAKGKL